MKTNTPKIPTKGAGKKLREFYEKNRNKSKASDSLLEGLKPEKAKEAIANYVQALNETEESK